MASKTKNVKPTTTTDDEMVEKTSELLDSVANEVDAVVADEPKVETPTAPVSTEMPPSVG